MLPLGTCGHLCFLGLRSPETSPSPSDVGPRKVLSPHTYSLADPNRLCPSRLRPNRHHSLIYSARQSSMMAAPPRQGGGGDPFTPFHLCLQIPELL